MKRSTWTPLTSVAGLRPRSQTLHLLPPPLPFQLLPPPSWSLPLRQLPNRPNTLQSRSVLSLNKRVVFSRKSQADKTEPDRRVNTTQYKKLHQLKLPQPHRHLHPQLNGMASSPLPDTCRMLQC